jgi:hypothetical protein
MRFPFVPRISGFHTRFLQNASSPDQLIEEALQNPVGASCSNIPGEC